MVNIIKQHCQHSGGWINFSAYMQAALYESGLGYYSGGLQKFGEQGDFITAPEVSSLFGQCLANQVAEILQHMKQQDDPAYIIEFGAGSGVLAMDVLSHLEQLEVLPEKYFIIELSAELRQRQHQTIQDKTPHLLGMVEWLDTLPSGLANVIVLANEVLDAMPVERIRLDGEQPEIMQVGVENERLCSRFGAVDDDTRDAINAIMHRSHITFADGYVTEINMQVLPWLTAVEAVAEHMVLLLIDYGYNEETYYHADRSTGTLMCYYRHRAHDDIFWYPGLQDITAFVNFTDVAYAAVELGMDVTGFTTQSAFLLANGLSELHQEKVDEDIKNQIRLSQQVKTLTLPSEMGERFKVIALTKNYYEPIRGFSMLDMRNRL